MVRWSDALLSLSSSPQKVRKTFTESHRRSHTINGISAGQNPFGGHMRRSESRLIRVYTAVVVGSSPAGPTYVTVYTAAYAVSSPGRPT
jgi:hypothetical protein